MLMCHLSTEPMSGINNCLKNNNKQQTVIYDEEAHWKKLKGQTSSAAN